MLRWVTGRGWLLRLWHVQNENGRLKKEAVGLNGEIEALNLQLAYVKQEIEQLGEEHDKLIERVQVDTEYALAHEK